MTFYKKFEIVLIIVALILTGCAKEMAPTGGPKDTYAPEVKKANPKPNSLHFDSKKISITFNEFLSLKDASQKVTISPPLNKKPEVRLKGKTVIVELNDTLRQNTLTISIFGCNPRLYRETWDIFVCIFNRRRNRHYFYLRVVKNTKVASRKCSSWLI